MASILFSTACFEAVPIGAVLEQIGQGLLLAEGHLTKRLFASMLGRIDHLALLSG
jgi:hypothetical protein